MYTTNQITTLVRQWLTEDEDREYQCYADAILLLEDGCLECAYRQNSNTLAWAQFNAAAADAPHYSSDIAHTDLTLYA